MNYWLLRIRGRRRRQGLTCKVGFRILILRRMRKVTAYIRALISVRYFFINYKYFFYEVQVFFFMNYKYLFFMNYKYFFLIKTLYKLHVTQVQSGHNLYELQATFDDFFINQEQDNIKMARQASIDTLQR